MSQDQRSKVGSGKDSGTGPPIATPQLNLPKGGAAIRGIGDKFAANPVDGTRSLSVPIYVSPDREGFGPQFALSYESGSGNGPLGFGWNLALPKVTRKTDKGLPQYVDAQESDTFILAGTEDLVPALTLIGGQWQPEVLSRTLYGKQYTVHRYRPRVEGLFARTERWLNVADPQDAFWRSISKDNITNLYGKTSESRNADPADSSRIFSWLICEGYDDRGNAVVYQHKAEDSAGVARSSANERNRSEQSRSSYVAPAAVKLIRTLLVAHELLLSRHSRNTARGTTSIRFAISAMARAAPSILITSGI